MRLLRSVIAVLLGIGFSAYLHSVSITSTGPGNLDGYGEPIFVQNTYTLTAGNFARGNVKFLKGMNISGDLFTPIILQLNDIVDGQITFLTTSHVDVQQDLYLGNTASILFLNNDGFITANNHKIFFTEDLFITINGGGGLTLNNAMLDGMNNKLVTNIARGIFFEGSFAGIENMTVVGSSANGNPFDAFTTVIFRNVDFVLNPLGEFGEFPILCQNSVRFLGNPGTILHHIGNTITIDTASEVYIGPGVIYQWDPLTGLPLPQILFTDATSRLYLDNSIIHPVNTFGVSLPQNFTFSWTKGTVLLNGTVTCQTSGFSGSLHDFTINFGDGIASDDLNVFFLSGSRLVFDDLYLLNLRNVN
jgi:hypothetical protein